MRERDRTSFKTVGKEKEKEKKKKKIGLLHFCVETTERKRDT